MNKFCMECATQLIVAANGSVAICPNCGKSYTFTPTQTESPASTPTIDVYEETKQKIAALINLDKKAEAIEISDNYLKEHPQDYRAYLLRGAAELDLYKLDPVDAAIDRIWWDAKEKFEEGKKIATPEEVKKMKAECGEYCARVENVIKIFYELSEIEKFIRKAPTPPHDPEPDFNCNKAKHQEKLETLEKRLAEINAKYKQVEKEDCYTELTSRPLPKFFILRRIELKRRRALCYEAGTAKIEQLAAIAKERDKYQQEVDAELSAIQALEKQFNVSKAKYLDELSKYEQALADYETAQSNYQSKKAFFETDSTVLAIKAKTDSIKAQIAEYEQEIKRLEKQSKPFNANILNTTEYYLEKAAHREREQRLTLEKIKVIGKINDLKFKLLSPKPQPSLFDNE